MNRGTRDQVAALSLQLSAIYQLDQHDQRIAQISETLRKLGAAVMIEQKTGITVTFDPGRQEQA